MRSAPVLLAILAGLCWGVGEVATRAVLHTGRIGPFMAIALRSTVALPLIWLAFVAANRIAPETAGRAAESLGPRYWSMLIVGSGVIAGAAAMIAFYAALSLGEIGRVKPIAFAIAPATGVVLGWLLLGESMSVRKAAGVALILVGVVLLSVPARVVHAT
jgi:DME family drug/metabolite transporter